MQSIDLSRKSLGGSDFPSPHNQWQRGTNENTNGLLREYFLKQKDIADYTDEYIEHLSLTK